MVVNEPTHIDGALLDHVYVKKELVNSFKITTLVKNVYFSDHDVVKFKFTHQ